MLEQAKPSLLVLSTDLLLWGWTGSRTSFLTTDRVFRESHTVMVRRVGIDEAFFACYWSGGLQHTNENLWLLRRYFRRVWPVDLSSYRIVHRTFSRVTCQQQLVTEMENPGKKYSRLESLDGASDWKIMHYYFVCIMCCDWVWFSDGCNSLMSVGANRPLCNELK